MKWSTASFISDMKLLACFSAQLGDLAQSQEVQQWIWSALGYGPSMATIPSSRPCESKMDSGKETAELSLTSACKAVEGVARVNR